MLIYAVILFLTGLLFLGLAHAIAKGRTDLIHDYHQNKVQDKAAYGKAMGKALSVFGWTMLLSGTVSLTGRMGAAMAVLVLGFSAGIVCLVKVQKRHNGGLF